jgi:hypothetical protein
MEHTHTASSAYYLKILEKYYVCCVEIFVQSTRSDLLYMSLSRQEVGYTDSLTFRASGTEPRVGNALATDDV